MGKQLTFIHFRLPSYFTFCSLVLHIDWQTACYPYCSKTTRCTQINKPIQ